MKHEELKSIDTKSSLNKKMRIAFRHWIIDKVNLSNEIKLICHGLGGHSYSVTVKPIIEMSLNDNFDVLSIDWPGHGCSSLCFQEKPKLEDMGIALDEIVNYLKNKGYKKIHIIGHSMGSLFAIYWGLREKSDISLVYKLTAMNPGFHKLSFLDEYIIRFISKTPLQYAHSVLSHSLEWTDDIHMVCKRFEDPLELKYINDSLLVPLLDANKYILSNFQNQRINTELIWSENDPLINNISIEKLLTHDKYFKKYKFSAEYHELCTTRICGKQICQAVFNI